MIPTPMVLTLSPKIKFYSKSALVGGAYLCLGLCALSAAEEEAVPLFVLPEGETETAETAETAAAAETAKTADGALVLPDEAAEAASGEKNTGEVFLLPEFTVSTEKDVGYYSAHSLSGTRTSALIKNTPMTIDVVNEELLDDLDLREINDLTSVLAGVEKDDTSEFNNRSLTMRGLRTTSQFFEFMPRRLAANGYNRGRVEVIRGSNSLVYGQAAPGGKLNLLAKRAEFNKDAKSVSFSAGSHDKYQGKIDINEVINDKIAVRFMGVHSEAKAFEDYNTREFEGFTLETTYRPTEKTEIRLHLETVEMRRTGKSSWLTDQTRFGSTGTFDNLLWTSEFVDYLPDAVINDIINHRVAPRNNSGTRDSVPDFFTTKQDIKDFYDALAPDDDKHGIYVAPNSYSDTKGHYILGDVTHNFTDNLVLKVAAAQEHAGSESLTRPNSGIRLSNGSNEANPRYYVSGGQGDDPDVDLILSGASVEGSRFQETEGFDDTDSLRVTLAWQIDIASSTQQFIFGFDYDSHTTNSVRKWLYPFGSLDPVGNGVIDSTTSRLETIHRLDGSDGTPLAIDTSIGEFLHNSIEDQRIDTTAGWLANSGSYFNGRLNTLFGIRFDMIETESLETDFRWNKNNDPTFSDPVGFGTGEVKKGEFSQWSPSLGVLYWLNSNIAIFANYSKSIESPSGFETNVFGDLVPPQYGEGMEVGFKFEALDGKLNGAVMAYEIEKENHSAGLSRAELESIYPIDEYPELYLYDEFGDLTATNFKGNDEPGSIVEVRGIETTIYYNPTRELSFIFGYAFLDTEKTALAEGLTEGLGDKIEGTAAHSATLTARYGFKEGALKGFSFGTNFKYRSESLYDTVTTDAGDREEIWLSDTLEQGVFIGYSTKLGKSRKAPKLKLKFQVRNLWDTQDLVANSNLRGNAKAKFTSPRSYNLSASVSF